MVPVTATRGATGCISITYLIPVAMKLSVDGISHAVEAVR